MDYDMAQTLYDKLWDARVVADEGDGTGLLYIDRMMIHEVSSPQAFAGLAERGLLPHRPLAHLAVADHAVPTRNRANIARTLGPPNAYASTGPSIVIEARAVNRATENRMPVGSLWEPRITTPAAAAITRFFGLNAA